MSIMRPIFARILPGSARPADGASVVPRRAGRGIAIAAAAVGLLAASCSLFDSPDDSPRATISTSNAEGKYQGGPVRFVASLSNCGADPSKISWRTGRATVLDQGGVLRDGLLEADTIVLRWDTLPWATYRRNDSGRVVDSLWCDTIAVYLDGNPLATYVVQMVNILPRLDSVLVGHAADTSGLRPVLPRGDTLAVAVHPGEFAYIRMRTTDPDRNFRARWLFGSAAGRPLTWASNDPGDSLLLWRAPNALFDTTVGCTLVDGMGTGRRVYWIRLSTYLEQGSVWAGQRDELVKFGASAGGALVEVARLRRLSEITSLDIDPARFGGLLVATDRGTGKFLRYTSEGLPRPIAATAVRPRAVACDVDGGFCWVGDQDSSGQRGVVSRVDGSSAVLGGLPGPVSSVVVDQNRFGRVWFASADSGFVGRATGGVLDTLLRGVARRPAALAFDESRGICWVSDLAAGTVIALDSTGQEIRRISGLVQPVGLSAAGGKLWVIDAAQGTAMRYSHQGALEATATGFSGPQAVAILSYDPDRAWIADTESGRIVLLDGATVVSATRGQGLNRPDRLAVHRGAR